MLNGPSSFDKIVVSIIILKIGFSETKLEKQVKQNNVMWSVD